MGPVRRGSGAVVQPDRPEPVALGDEPVDQRPEGRQSDATGDNDDVAAFCDTLRASKPVDPAKPVQVAGDPERRIAAQRMKTGIPVGPNLLAKVREIAIASGAPWIIGN